MSKTPKRPKDPNQLAKMMIDIGSGEGNNITPREESSMASLGHLGGLKGGVARAKSLSAARRSEIAKIAAKKRWGKNERD